MELMGWGWGLTTGCSGRWGQRRFTARWPSQRLVVVRPPPLSVSASAPRDRCSGHRESRRPQGSPHVPTRETAPSSRIQRTAMGVTPQKPPQRGRDGCGPRGAAGIHDARGMWAETRQERGRPSPCRFERTGRPSRRTTGRRRRGGRQLSPQDAETGGPRTRGRADRHTEPAQATVTGQGGPGNTVNLLAGDRAEGPGPPQASVRHPR